MTRRVGLIEKRLTAFRSGWIVIPCNPRAAEPRPAPARARGAGSCGGRLGGQAMLRLTRLARSLRRGATAAERRLWQGLRRKQVEGFRFRRQVILGDFIADFAWFDARLVVEVDGATHSNEVEIARDAARPRRARLRNPTLHKRRSISQSRRVSWTRSIRGCSNRGHDANSC
jgi:very-short-patch-repair endonuclease